MSHNNNNNNNNNEDNVLSMTANLPYGPPVIKALIIIGLFSDFLIVLSVVKLVVRYLLGEEKPVFALLC